MFDFLNRPYPFNTDLRYSLKLGFGMAIGVFLFILFFQPLQISNPNVEAYILTIAGFGGITLLLIGTLKIILPWAFRGMLRLELWDLKRELIFQVLFWVLNSVAFSFYLAYVGKVPLTMYLAFKIVLISLCIPIFSMLSYEILLLRIGNEELGEKLALLEERFSEELSDTVRSFRIFSDNRAEELSLDIRQLLLAKSAENYVEFVYEQDGARHKKLLRTTFRSVEDQLREFPEMVRCHRTFIINTVHVDKLLRTPRGTRIRIKNLEEEIPVSRQYILSIRTSLGEK